MAESVPNAVEQPVAWLIERPEGTGKQQTVKREVVLSPLTDDTFIDEGDAAYPLYLRPNIEAPAKMQYFYKDANCKASRASDPDCICWHDEGQPPLSVREQESPYIQWRDAVPSAIESTSTRSDR